MCWVFILLLFFVSCEKETAPESIRPVKAVQVSETSLSENQMIFPGTLRAFKRADLSFRVDGIVILRDITVGYEAKKDETLIQLDPREYEIALKKAEGNVQSIQAQLDFAGRDYQRMQNIFTKDPGAISENLLDRSKEKANKLKADLTVAQGDLEKASDDLSYTTLKAPFDGIVAAIYVENHEQVRAKQPVLRFLDTEEREMEINVPEKYINLLLEGKNKLRFNIILDAFPQKIFLASIKEIGTEASSTTQTYPVILSLQDIPMELSLLAGMNGKAVLKLPKTHLDTIFKLPKSAIFTRDSITYVFVVDPKTETVHKKEVAIDENNREDNVIIRDGLSSGEWVVVAGTSFLSEGQKVKLLEKAKS